MTQIADTVLYSRLERGGFLREITILVKMKTVFIAMPAALM